MSINFNPYEFPLAGCILLGTYFDRDITALVMSTIFTNLFGTWAKASNRYFNLESEVCIGWARLCNEGAGVVDLSLLW